MATKAHLEGNKRYLQTLDHVTIRMPKGKKEEITAHAQEQGKSLNGFINDAIDEKMERDDSAE